MENQTTISIATLLNTSKRSANMAVYVLWKEAVAQCYDDPYAPPPTTNDLAECYRVRRGFCEYFPEPELPLFLNLIVSKWASVCSWFKQNTTAYRFGEIPTMGWISYYLDGLLEWYSKNRGCVAPQLDHHHGELTQS